MLELKTLLEESHGRLHDEWSEAYFVTLIDRCSCLSFVFLVNAGP